MKVKCNQCGFIAEEEKFPHGRDFFQNSYVAACPNCDNSQSPGDASMRMFGGERPFVYVREKEPEAPEGIPEALSTVLLQAKEAS